MQVYRIMLCTWERGCDRERASGTKAEWSRAAGVSLNRWLEGTPAIFLTHYPLKCSVRDTQSGRSRAWSIRKGVAVACLDPHRASREKEMTAIHRSKKTSLFIVCFMRCQSILQSTRMLAEGVYFLAFSLQRAIARNGSFVISQATEFFSFSRGLLISMKNSRPKPYGIFLRVVRAQPESNSATKVTSTSITGAGFC